MRIGNYPEAFIADHMGSLVVETAMDNIQKQLREDLLNESLSITNRFSPGYCGWNVSEQHKLFKLIPAEECDIRLTESALMQPIKSISGIIGIGEGVKFKHYSCNHCSITGCKFRGRKK
jgi:cobalamin-dependent methionine synthase I